MTAPAPLARKFTELTDREYEVLDLLAAGLSTAAITARLGIAPKTMSNLVSSILAKLHVADRTQAVLAAREAGPGRS